MEGRFGPGAGALWWPRLLRGGQGASQAAPEVIRRAQGGRLGLAAEGGAVLKRLASSLLTAMHPSPTFRMNSKAREPGYRARLGWPYGQRGSVL